MATPPISLDQLGVDVEWPDHEAATGARESADPSLGRIVELTEWLSGVQSAFPPRPFARVRVVTFASSVDDRLLALADELGVGVRLADAPRDDVAVALAAGVALADDEIDSGTDLLLAAYPDAEAAATVAVSVLTSTEPVKVVVRGAAATDPEAWMDHTAAVRDARRRVIGFRHQPHELLFALNRPTLAAAVGFVLRAAARRTPVLLDGAGITAAALIAYEAQPRAIRWWWTADTTPDPAHTLALTTMGLRPVLDLGLGRGDGTAALLALPVLRAAAALGGVRD